MTYLPSHSRWCIERPGRRRKPDYPGEVLCSVFLKWISNGRRLIGRRCSGKRIVRISGMCIRCGLQASRGAVNDGGSKQ
jgi:hypothetical protein